MRRWVVPTVALLALVACAQQARPAGVAENWLRSLNQGAAGRPDRYAPDGISQQVVPGWQELDPGRFDRIEVSAVSGNDARVAFRLTDVDGTVTAGTAQLGRADASWHVTSVTISPAEVITPLLEHGDAQGGLPPGWPLALLVAAVCASIAVGLLSLVRRSAHTRA